MAREKLTRRESLKLASSAVALGAGLGVGLLGREAAAAGTEVSLKFELHLKGSEKPVGFYELPQNVVTSLQKLGASALTVQVVGYDAKGAQAFGGFRLPASVQLKLENRLRRR